MALDTANRRASAIHVSLPWRGLLPRPDGAINAGDRKQAAAYYRNIPPEPSADVTYQRDYTVPGWHRAAELL